VAVGVEHVGGVVAGVIAGALSRLAVAAISSCGRVRVEAAHVVVFAREGNVDVLRRLAGDEEQGAAVRPGREGGVIDGLAPDRESGRCADRRVERGRNRDVRDADGDVIDVALRSWTVVMDSSEGVAG